MIDPALIARCTDPALKPAFVEQFIAAAGSTDPLAISVTSDGRLIFLAKAKDPDDAVAIIRPYIGRAVVKVGLMQYPIITASQDRRNLDPDLFDSCANLKLGTHLLANVMRIVAKWYGNPQGDEAAALMFEDSVVAWKSGYFEGVRVFNTPEPGSGSPQLAVREAVPTQPNSPSPGDPDIGRAEMRVDLSRLGAKP